ncbi:MAG TPA: hypothetical protein VF719_05230, partial [Abditibacteriaceae bacterium]
MSLSRFYLSLLLLLCVVQSWRPLGGGYDFWAHAAVGRWIANHGQIPKHGLFLWSAPDFPWVYHSWVSQWLSYQLLAGVGPVGVMVFTALVVCLVFGLLWHFWNKRVHGEMPAVALLLFCVAILLSTPRFQPRQELLTALLLVGFLIWLVSWNEQRTEETPARHIPWLDKQSLAIVALIALWVNLHALVMLAVGLLVITAGCDCLQYRFDRRARVLLLVAALGCLATLLNPWGWGYWDATGQLRPGGQAAHIEEWMPVWTGWPAMRVFVIGESILLIAAVWGWARNPSRRWAELLWLLFVGLLFLRSRRLMWILAIVCLVVMASNGRSFDSQQMWLRWRAFTRQTPEAMPAGMQRMA